MDAGAVICTFSLHLNASRQLAEPLSRLLTEWNRAPEVPGIAHLGAGAPFPT
jgi:hypothetical protein